MIFEIAPEHILRSEKEDKGGRWQLQPQVDKSGGITSC